LYLLLAIAGIAIDGRFCGSCGQKLGLIKLFIGVGSNIVGIVGNAAEHSSAIIFPLKGKMNLL
jgi:Ca2+/H+ antiporter